MACACEHEKKVGSVSESDWVVWGWPAAAVAMRAAPRPPSIVGPGEKRSQQKPTNEDARGHRGCPPIFFLQIHCFAVSSDHDASGCWG